jgi:hypothetical protein
MTFKTLLAASALIALTGGAFADDYSGGVGSNIVNGQVNLQNTWSNLNGNINSAGSDAVVAGAAAGNLVDITTMNNPVVKTSQIVGAGASIGSNVNVDMNNIWGNATVANQVVCNGASVSTDPTYSATSNYQKCNASDPYGAINTNISNISGNAIVQGSTLGNSFEADSNAPNMPITSKMINNSGTVSNVTANLYNVGGTATLSSSAIGNTSQIIHYNTN